MNIRILIIALSAAAALFTAGSLQAKEPVGKMEFTKNCAACHGGRGKGNGPIVDFLKQAPSDLTQIQKNNDGRFPMQDIYDTIVDAGQNRAHGDQIMPVWGERYALEQIAEEGEYGIGSSRAEIQARVLELVFYLAGIQE